MSLLAANTKKHFVFTALLMIFIFIVHCAKEKKMNVKKCICTTCYERDVQRFGISCKNDGNCDIAVKERKSFQRYEIVKF